jgi:hypothetical protein
MIGEFLANYGIEIGTISVGALAVMGWQVVRFFKKDKYLLPFVNIAKTKLNEVFGKDNVTDFINIAQKTKIKDVQALVESKWNDFLELDNKLQLLFRVWLATGVLDELPDLKAEVEDVIE